MEKKYKLELKDNEVVAIEDENGNHLISEMAQFVGKGFIPTPIEKIEIKPYDFTVEDEID